MPDRPLETRSSSEGTIGGPLYSPAAVKRILSAYGLRPNKALGQNFLVDKNTVDRIMRAVDVRPGDWVIEIGPGLGALTQELASSQGNVVAVEKDGELVRVLTDLFAGRPNVRFVHADALDVDVRALLPTPTPERVKIVGNLPYYVTSPLLIALLDTGLPAERIVVMIQREVADRLKARPGTKAYGSLTVGVSWRAAVESVGRVPPTVFYPAPSVDSEVLLLRPRERPLEVGDPALFRRVVKAAFGMRRKTLRNALKSLDFAHPDLAAALAEAGVDPERRGETLSLEEFGRLSLALSERCVCYNQDRGDLP